jgi:hypothetical protein
MQRYFPFLAIALLSIPALSQQNSVPRQIESGATNNPLPHNPTPASVSAIVTNGTANFLSMFADSSGTLANSAVFQSIFNANPSVSVGGTTQLGAMTLIGNVPSGDTAGMALYNQGGGGGASVSLDMYNTFANAGIPQAKIKAVDDGNYSDHITFWTKNPGAANNPVSERVRITSTGNVGIGTNLPGQKLEVLGNLRISGYGNGLVFPDGSVQTTAIVTPNGSGTNTGVGQYALSSITSGSSNTAIGASALASTSIGYGNTSIGFFALQSNTIGTFNTATGSGALQYSTTGNGNTADGASALQDTTTGTFNTATGNAALNLNTTGSYNSANGYSSLLYNTTGSHNTALGASSGATLTTGNYNIEIANQGTPTDDHVIRIGDVQSQTFIAGISGVNVSGVPVLVSSTGQLGVASSSRRYKEDIADMGDASSNLMRLRPVTYRYKQPYSDGSKPLDFGLIAEEVAEVYPDLVANSQDGQIQTVMYQKLTPMLLNEVQKLQAQNASQAQQIREMNERLARLEQLLESMAPNHR